MSIMEMNEILDRINYYGGYKERTKRNGQGTAKNDYAGNNTNR